jgi:outer membrane lipoprotein-sorting protein
MSDIEQNDRDEFTAHVVSAFERMPVAPRPSVAETIEMFERSNRGAPADPMRSKSSMTHFSVSRRLAIGGIGVSAAAVVVIAMLLLNPRQPLSAMERMARQLREVTSYSYHLSSTNTRNVQDGKQITTWSEEGDVYWRAPDAFHFEDKIVKREAPVPPDGPAEELLEHFLEVFPAGKPGVLVDHKRRTFLREDFEPIGSRTYPWQPLKMIREGEGEVIRELGTKGLGGKQARGYVTRLKGGDPPRSHDWEVWVDPETDLPLELGYTVDDRKEPRSTTVLRVTDFQWNIELDARLFDSKPPEGYTEKLPER